MLALLALLTLWRVRSTSGDAPAGPADAPRDDRAACGRAALARGCALSPDAPAALAPPHWVHAPKCGSSWCAVLEHARCGDAAFEASSRRSGGGLDASEPPSAPPSARRGGGGGGAAAAAVGRVDTFAGCAAPAALSARARAARDACGAAALNRRHFPLDARAARGCGVTVCCATRRAVRRRAGRG